MKRTVKKNSGRNMKTKISYLLVSSALFIYAVLSGYVIISQDIHDVLACADEGTLRIPFAKQICRTYLVNFRGDENDIRILQKTGGAALVTNGKSTISQKKEILQFLISKGLDINGPDESGITPLQGAVLQNSVETATMLLSLGANPLLKGSRIDLTPLDLAIKLKSKQGITQINKKLIKTLKRATRAIGHDGSANASGG